MDHRCGARAEAAGLLLRYGTVRRPDLLSACSRHSPHHPPKRRDQRTPAADAAPHPLRRLGDSRIQAEPRLRGGCATSFTSASAQPDNATTNILWSLHTRRHRKTCSGRTPGRMGTGTRHPHGAAHTGQCGRDHRVTTGTGGYAPPAAEVRSTEPHRLPDPRLRWLGYQDLRLLRPNAPCRG